MEFQQSCKENKKKICFITTTPITIKAFILNMAKYLYEKGNYEIYCICNDEENFSEQIPNYIKYIPVKMKRGISITGITAIMRLYKIFKQEQFDIIQYSTPNASMYASIAGKIAKIKVRLYCQWGIRYVGFSGIQRKIFKILEKIVAKNSTWIEPDSYGNLKFSQREKLYSPENSSVVWNGSASGVNLEKFNITNKEKWREEIRSKYNIRNEEIVIGFVGRLDRDKGINELLRAFYLCKNENIRLKLLLIGNADKTETIDEKLYKIAKKDENIIFTGNVKDTERYFSAMDIFTLPSYREGFGSVVIEAETMEIPVIVTNIPGPTDAMVEDETGLVIEKANVEELKNAIKKLADNPFLRNEMGKKGHKFSKENFDENRLFEYILEDRNRLLDL